MSQVLRVGAAFPDPPFNGADGTGADGADGGLDIDMMTAIAELLGRDIEFIPYVGQNFGGIFDALNAGEYDCVTAGTTVTPDREKKAAFCAPYLVSGQSLAVDTTRHPNVHSIDDLQGLVVAAQHGNTSQPILQGLVDAGRAKSLRLYDYGNIRSALQELTTGGCDAFMKLAPVLTELVKPIAGVEVVQRGISTEYIGTAVRLDDHALLRQINEAQAELEGSGRLAQMRAKWVGAPELDQSGPGK